jgi:hypothetical protein
MKKILMFFACFLLTQISLSQILRDSITGKVTFIKVNEINLPEGELKLHANSWIIENFKNTNSGIKLNTDKKIIAKGIFESTILASTIRSKSSSQIDYIFEISFKENKYRIKLHSFDVSSKTFPLFASLVFERPTMSIETCRNNLIKSAEFEGSSRKKRMLKIANNPKKMKEYFEYHQVRDNHVIEQIKNRCNSISKSLHNYLLNQVEEKW